MNTALLIFHELLGWRAWLDIILIALGFFFLHRTLVRLGTWQILVGILAAFLVYIVARMLHLEGIEWIFQNISQVAVLALIVIFQPELRKIFEKVVSLHNKNSAVPDMTLAETVGDSLWKLGSQRRGAIIVFPGNEPITEKISGGHRLSAVASAPLIMSIFDPNSPGHDGAVIVENNKLVSFGVRLPMSQTSRLAEEYGTRHHAAMGLAEVTDSLVFAVSEERGTVSVFENGNMSVLTSAESIVEQIREHQTRHGLFDFSRMGLQDRRAMIQAVACLMIAGALWTGLAAANRQVIERVITLPITYSQPDESLLLTGNRPEEAKVHLAGPKSAINDFLLGMPTVKIDLSTMVEGKQTLLITAENLGIDKGLSIVESSPAQVEITLAKIEKRLLPVIPQLVGSLPPHLKLRRVTVTPAEVLVMAPPAKKGEKALTLSTTPIYLNSILASDQILGKIIAAPTIQPVQKPWHDVEISVQVEPIR